MKYEVFRRCDGVEQARLFWAVNLPADVKLKLAELQARMQRKTADVKWVEQQNLHLTVKFLGNAGRDRINEIVRAVESAVADSGLIRLELGGTVFFPHKMQPQVIWVGVRGELDKFRRLHHLVEKSLAGIGFPSENRGFSPHLTLGRVRYPRGAGGLARDLEAMARESACFGRVDVKTVDLMESELTSRGPVYSVLARVKLAGV